MPDVVEGEVSFGDTKITIRGPQEFVQSEITRLAGLASGKRSERAAKNDADPGLLDHEVTSGAASEREFVALKRPKGHHEIVTVLGFWLTAHGSAEFSEDDMRRAYIRAGVRPPKVVSQALRDAKRLLDSIEQGTKRGKYRLTNHGERIVRFDLPRK